MDIAQFVVASRNKALLYGDYSTYKSQLAHRLLNCRKKLRLATRHRGKFSPKANSITAEKVAQDVNYVYLYLLTAERAWAAAMAMKAVHAASKKGAITGHTRSHIVSRLDKAAKYAERLAEVLEEASASATIDRLEASAYAALLRGSAAFEKQAWLPCVENYAVVWTVFRALSFPPPDGGPISLLAPRPDLFRDLLTDTVEPSLRYAAYQLKMPRSKPIAVIAAEAWDAAAPPSLKAALPGPGGGRAVDAAAPPVASSHTLRWRGRDVCIEDAGIASAWAALDRAKADLATALPAAASATAAAAAYDGVLTASQDVVDAVKAAMDDLRADGVVAGDAAMQLLYVARTAAHYDLISWRIGRNRVLTGDHDGLAGHAASTAKQPPGSKGRLRTPTPARLLARLKEKVVLYDGTLQSLDAAKELPGVASDEALSAQLDATAGYFVALKSLAIADSHHLAGHPVNALALVKHAHDAFAAAAPVLQDPESSPNAPDALRTMHVSPADAAFLQHYLDVELRRFRALVHVEALAAHQTSSAAPASLLWSDNLRLCPATPVSLDRIVAYPPRLEPVPVKPILLDIAWNYIDYPGKAAPATATAASTATVSETAAKEEAPSQKRGWFGFGR